MKPPEALVVASGVFIGGFDGMITAAILFTKFHFVRPFSELHSSLTDHSPNYLISFQ